jgi:hypothetical protein
MNLFTFTVCEVPKGIVICNFQQEVGAPKVNSYFGHPSIDFVSSRCCDATPLQPLITHVKLCITFLHCNKIMCGFFYSLLHAMLKLSDHITE